MYGIFCKKALTDRRTLGIYFFDECDDFFSAFVYPDLTSVYAACSGRDSGVELSNYPEISFRRCRMRYINLDEMVVSPLLLLTLGRFKGCLISGKFARKRDFVI